MSCCGGLRWCRRKLGCWLGGVSYGERMRVKKDPYSSPSRSSNAISLVTLGGSFLFLDLPSPFIVVVPVEPAKREISEKGAKKQRDPEVSMHCHDHPQTQKTKQRRKEREKAQLTVSRTRSGHRLTGAGRVGRVLEMRWRRAWDGGAAGRSSGNAGLGLGGGCTVGNSE